MISRAAALYLVRRLVLYVATFFAAAAVNFVIPRLIPGDPIRTLLVQMEQQGRTIPGGEDLVKIYRQRFGLDGDLFTQFVNYFARLLQGDLGFSIMAFPSTVQELVGKAIPWTIGLLSVTVLLSWGLGNLLGAFIGWRRGSKVDAALTSVCLFLSQIPYYFFALILIFLFAYMLPIFPAKGAYGYTKIMSFSLDFAIDVLYHSILPSLSILVVSLGGWMITMRSMIVGVLGEDYLKLAEAKGLKKNKILMGYALRNALLPQVTGLAMSLGFIVSGAMLTEIIFAYPGVGALMYDALGRLDYPLLQGILLIIIGAVLSANLLIDFLYPLVDPRVGYKGG